jgi:bacillithiol synthase
VSRVAKVPYSIAGFGNTLTHDLAYGVPAALQFFPAQSWRDVMHSVKQREYKRADVANVLETRARTLGAPQQALDNIQKLRDANTFVIATGQQAGFLGGPLYTLHKALSAIKLAQYYEEQSGDGAKFIPVFWVAGDDHDLAEIDHAWFIQHGGEVERTRLSLTHESLGCSACDAWLDRAPENLQKLREDLSQKLQNAEHADEFVSLYAKHNLAESFATLIYRWLGELGIVVAESSEMRRFAGPLLSRDLAEHDVVARLIREAAMRMESARYEPGFTGQARPGPHFFIASGESRIRAHLDANGNEFYERSAAFESRGLAPKKHTQDEMFTSIETQPALFSASAALRPVVQQFIFPVVSVLLGPGEIAYWAQLKNVHDHFNVVFPQVLPRATLTLIDQSGDKAIRKLGLELSSRELFNDFDALSKLLFIGGRVGGSLDQRIQRVLAEIDAMQPEVLAVDSSFKTLLDKARQRVEHELRRVVDKTRESADQREGAALSRLRYLNSLVCPRNLPQERVLSIAQFIEKSPALPRILLDIIEPLSTEHLVATLD